ncbi:CAP domain-containing protein [Streptococcus caballi]|uniref:CAP domain-containing protein n=1 Tax=Streptococcus caballi TaxID=439220 RepID=UPI00036FA18A|nr:CAP domain-containing protein [Streptococcus caballi]
MKRIERFSLRKVKIGLVSVCLLSLLWIADAVQADANVVSNPQSATTLQSQSSQATFVSNSDSQDLSTPSTVVSPDTLLPTDPMTNCEPSPVHGSAAQPVISSALGSQPASLAGQTMGQSASSKQSNPTSPAQNAQVASPAVASSGQPDQTQTVSSHSATSLDLNTDYQQSVLSQAGSNQVSVNQTQPADIENLASQTPPFRPAQGNVDAAATTFASLDGTYLAINSQVLLNRLNAIRKEAFDEGLVAEYVPLKWSFELEKLAQTRAAEATVKQSHTRPNEFYTFSNSTEDGFSAAGENLAWNFRRGFDSTVRATEQFYEEKPDYLNYLKTGVETKQIGHYMAMIDPNYRYVGIATFYANSGYFFTTTAQQFSDQELLTEKQSQLSGRFQQELQVSENGLTNLKLSLTSPLLKVKEAGQAQLTADLLVTGFQTGTLPAKLSHIDWSSSDTSILSIDSKGGYLGKKAGQATLFAKVANFILSQSVLVQLPPQVQVLAKQLTQLQVNENSINRKLMSASYRPREYSSFSNFFYSPVNRTSDHLTQLTDDIQLSLNLLPVYVLYHPLTHKAFYTCDWKERAYLLELGWQDGGIAWYAPSNGLPVYRLYHPTLGQHYYTDSLTELQDLQDMGWRYEGIAWYQ